MPERMTAKHLGPEFRVTITEILVDRGTVWDRVDSGYQVQQSRKNSSGD